MALRAPTRRVFGTRAAAQRRTASMGVFAAVSKPTLYDVPVSNHGARVRFVVYKKGMDKDCDIVAPSQLGGLKSPGYLALNPQGKMPLLVMPDGTSLPESEVIVSYLLDKYSGVGPSLRASTPELRARGALATRIHDIYIASIQGCMYRKMESAQQRSAEIGQLAYQLDALEKVFGPEGPFVCGAEITAADGALFPTFAFITLMLPKYFGWADVFAGRPKLKAWWEAVQRDAVAKRVLDEVNGGLAAWEKADRWKEMGILDHVKDTNYKWAH